MGETTSTKRGVEATETPSFKRELLATLPSLRAFAVSLSGKHDKADDLVQDTVMKAWAKQSSFEMGTNIKAWLFTIVRREHQRFVKKAARQPEALAAGDDIPAPDEFADWDAAVRPQLVAAALEDLKADVSETTWQAFHLTAVEGLSGEQAADRLGITRAAVYLARGRVLARIRERLAGESGA